MKAVLLFGLLLSLNLFAQTSPDYIFGDSWGSGWNQTTGTQGTTARSNSYKFQFQANNSADFYFKFGESTSNTDGSGFWVNSNGASMFYNGNGAIWNASYQSNMIGGGWIYFRITSGRYYILKTRKDPSNTNANFSIQEVSAAPVTITGVTDNFRSASSDLTVYITLSGSKSAEEKVFVRYTTDNWTNSYVTAEATGSGTSYTATIPGARVTATTDNKYYVFTTTLASPAASDADLLAINYNDNSGNYYNIFEKYITISVTNQQAGGPGGPWMFNTDPSNRFDPRSWCIEPYGGVFAYTYSEWNTLETSTNGLRLCTDPGGPCMGYDGLGVKTNSSCSAEQTNLLSGTSDVKLFMGRGNLTYFNHINITNPGANWAIEGEAGDERIYTGTYAYISVNGALKLVFDSYRSYLRVPYFGGAITFNSVAKINVAASDPLWVKEFDPFGTGQVILDAGSSFSPVIQQCFGSYNWTVTIRPNNYQEFVYTEDLGTSGSSIDVSKSFDQGRVAMRFTQATKGGGNLEGITVNYIKTAPGVIGSLPAGVNQVLQPYWRIGTTLNTFTTSLTFNLSDITGITNSANLRILKRDFSSAPWEIYGDAELLSGNTLIRANNVTDLSEWAVAEASTALPVELSSFCARVKEDGVNLIWQTATEVSNYGFEIERRYFDGNWEKIAFVNGSGNSNAVKCYEYFDNTLTAPGKYFYRLKQLDNDGSFEYSHSIEIGINRAYSYSLAQNYPNPFNPLTKINYTIPEPAQVKLTLYDMLGKEVRVLVNEFAESGTYNYELDASDIPSGIYIYQLKANSFTAAKTLSILK